MGKACAGHDNHLAVVAGEGRLRSIRALMPHECFVPKPEQPLLQQRLHAQTAAHQQSSFRNEQGFEGRGTARQCNKRQIVRAERTVELACLPLAHRTFWSLSPSQLVILSDKPQPPQFSCTMHGGG